MTHILTRLAALGFTSRLLPYPSCGAQVQFRKALHVEDGNTDAIIHKEPSEGGFIEFGNGATDESVLTLWNSRPREATLIALVHEAGESE
jgi:hypothetical protein